MTTYPKSPNEKTTKGMMLFPRMLDKIRMHARGELHEDYHKNLGASKAADGACCNFLRVNYADLRERVLQGGSDEEILEWCFEKGRRLIEGDIVVWNGFASKLGWRDFMSPRFQKIKGSARCRRSRRYRVYSRFDGLRRRTEVLTADYVDESGR